MNKFIKKLTIFSILFTFISTPLVSVNAQGITPPIDYNEVRVIRTTYLTNSQVRELANAYERNASSINLIAILTGIANQYVGAGYGIAGWLVSNYSTGFRNVADAGMGIKVVTYEKVNWDGYSPRIYNKYYTY